jgi:DNA-binding LytR/AlgR family response regulator
VRRRDPPANDPHEEAAAHKRIRHVKEENRQLMRKNRTSAATAGSGRVLLHLAAGLRQVLDSDEVYFVEAKGDDTEVRTRAARPLRDLRPIGILAASFVRRGFVRTHRNYLVNPRHVRLVRRRPRGEDWELTLAPPVNAVLPVSRNALAALWSALGED